MDTMIKWPICKEKRLNTNTDDAAINTQQHVEWCSKYTTLQHIFINFHHFHVKKSKSICADRKQKYLKVFCVFLFLWYRLAFHHKEWTCSIVISSSSWADRTARRKTAGMVEGRSCGMGVGHNLINTQQKDKIKLWSLTGCSRSCSRRKDNIPAGSGLILECPSQTEEKTKNTFGECWQYDNKSAVWAIITQYLKLYFALT